MMKWAVFGLALMVLAVSAQESSTQEPCQQSCTKIYSPVCGSDGQTYANDCVMNSTTCGKVEKAYDGECQSEVVDECPEIPKVCTMIYDPVCGSDGQTYASDCAMRAGTCEKVEKAYDGECQSEVVDECPEIPKVCTMIYDPVCGSDGQTYASNCRMRAGTCGKVEEAYKGECRAADPCPEVNKACTREYRPVCGNDGVTYSNKCVMTANTCNKVESAHDGPCQTSETA